MDLNNPIIHFKKPLQIRILFLIFTSFMNQCQSFDPKFQACMPKSCGDGLIMKYPFWIQGEHEAFCGYPHFEVICNDNKSVLRVSNDEFFVKNISYSNNWFVVSNTAFYDTNCPVPRLNYNIHGTPFTYSPDNDNLIFFYNCTSAPTHCHTYKVNCESNDNLHSFAIFHKEALNHTGCSSDKCQKLVNVPVDKTAAVISRSLLRMSYAEILKVGFRLDWNVPDCGQCEGSGGQPGFDHNQFVCFCQDKPHQKSCDGSRHVKLKVAIGVASAGGVVLLMSIGLFFYLRRYKKRHSLPYTNNRSLSSDPSSIISKDTEKGSRLFGVHLFSYEELEEATDNFSPSKELGDGGFGTVYYGKLHDGREVAVKRLYENNYKRIEQFMNEVEILTRLRHPNLVSLYGCTSRHCRELLLVYECISNGTVADHLHGQKVNPGMLPWRIRMDIAIQTASALTYLHASDIIHRDVKTSNILLDMNFRVKVADFGLSRLFPTNRTHISTAPQGTPGYVDPEYYECYQLTDKSDVYSFGVVLIELISSKPAVDITRHRQEINLSSMAINKIQHGAVDELVDPCLEFESNFKVRKMINAVAEVAFQCLQGVKDMRPSMLEVLESLKYIQNDGHPKGEAEEMDIREDDVVLQKNETPPFSPDSVASNAKSLSVTPNTSG